MQAEDEEHVSTFQNHTSDGKISSEKMEENESDRNTNYLCVIAIAGE